MATRNRIVSSSALAVGTLALLALAGCSGADALINHGELDVHTHLSETIFLDPVPDRLHTIYVRARNTSDYPDIDVRGPLVQALQVRGYTIVDDPNQAHYMLQVNVLQAGKLQQNQTGQLLAGGYGEPLLAGAVAGGLVAGGTGNYGASVGVGLGIAAADFLVNEAFQDVTYAVTTDILIAERPLHGEKVAQSKHIYRSSGNGSYSAAVTDSTPYSYGVSTGGTANSTETVQDVRGFSDFQKYQVRDVAYADKVNLKMAEAIPTLVNHLTSSLANLFE